MLNTTGQTSCTLGRIGKMPEMLLTSTVRYDQACSKVQDPLGSPGSSFLFRSIPESQVRESVCSSPYGKEELVRSAGNLE